MSLLLESSLAYHDGLFTGSLQGVRQDIGGSGANKITYLHRRKYSAIFARAA